MGGVRWWRPLRRFRAPWVAAANGLASSNSVEACRFGNQKEERGEVIDLVYFHGKSVKEVAEIVGIAAPTVKTRMFYARKKLAEFVATA
jgi:RNA polymerase sigma-70 factor, ECF subfamily